MKKSVTSIDRNPKGRLEDSKQVAAASSAESARLQECRQSGVPWKKWGPYLSERQWGTVREDYSDDGNAWDYFSHDQARSRAYRWGEDGLAGISDNHGVLCFALALWNGSDPILKERQLAAPVYRDEQLATGFTGDEAGLVALDLDGGPRPSLIAWGGGRAQLFRNGKTPVADSGLEALRDVVSIVPGDFDNDGLPDLCVITRAGAALYRNVNGHFQKQAALPRIPAQVVQRLPAGAGPGSLAP